MPNIITNNLPLLNLSEKYLKGKEDMDYTIEASAQGYGTNFYVIISPMWGGLRVYKTLSIFKRDQYGGRLQDVELLSEHTDRFMAYTAMYEAVVKHLGEV